MIQTANENGVVDNKITKHKIKYNQGQGRK